MTFRVFRDKIAAIPMLDETLPSPSERVTELVMRLQARFGRKDAATEEEEAKAIRYIIYVRKSTGETAGKQERTIGEQTVECKQLADRLGLRWADVIHEEQSAMTSDGRPKFREMLNTLKEGIEYQGIIAWAPDRLARNMKEGGVTMKKAPTEVSAFFMVTPRGIGRGSRVAVAPLGLASFAFLRRHSKIETLGCPAGQPVKSKAFCFLTLAVPSGDGTSLRRSMMQVNE